MKLSEATPADLAPLQLVVYDEYQIFGRVTDTSEVDGVPYCGIDWRVGLHTNLPFSEYWMVSIVVEPEQPNIAGFTEWAKSVQ